MEHLRQPQRVFLLPHLPAEHEHLILKGLQHMTRQQREAKVYFWANILDLSVIVMSLWFLWAWGGGHPEDRDAVVLMCLAAVVLVLRRYYGQLWAWYEADDLQAY